jgi:uncharacterized membrane protein
VSPYHRAVQLGVVAGLRANLPFALLARRTGRRVAQLGFLTSSLLELAGDKRSRTPSRLEAASFGGRVAAGTLAGAWVLRATGGPIVTGALLGAAGAGAGAYLGYHARMLLGRLTPLPDPVWGAVEDAVALGLGYAATRE